MEAAFKYPSDLTLLRQFRTLAAVLGDIGKAHQVVFILFRELLSRAQEGGPVGRLPAAGVEAFISSLSEVEPEEAVQRKIWEALISPSEWLQAQDGDYVCLRYMVLNGGAAAPSRERQGGNAKAFNRRQKKLDTEAFTQALLIPANKFVDEAGQALDAEATRRITRLIIACDNALYKPERPATAYSEGLIQSALQVLKQFTDEQIDIVVNQLSRHRDHPRLNGMTAEKLLPQFGDVLGAVN